MERAPPVASRETISNRIGSPSAANTDAGSTGAAACPPLASGLDMRGDVLRLDGPAFRVGAERLEAAMIREGVEPGFRDGEARPRRGRLQAELYEGSGLPRIIDPGLDGRRPPAEGEEALRLDALDHRLPADV